MCLLLLKPAGKDIPEEYIDESWRINHDGGGMAWAEPSGEIWWHKGFMNLKDMKAGMADNLKGKPAIVHFRFATHGLKNKDNCHPFHSGDGIMMAHNGVINSVRTRKDESDTAAFSRIILEPILMKRPDKMFDQDFKHLIEQMTLGSKLAFLNGKGDHVIIHEDMGVWDDGVWYSNRGYLPVSTMNARHNYCGGWQSDTWEDDFVYDTADKIWKQKPFDAGKRAKEIAGRLMEKTTTKKPDNEQPSTSKFPFIPINSTTPTEDDITRQQREREQVELDLQEAKEQEEVGEDFMAHYIGDGCEKCGDAFEDGMVYVHIDTELCLCSTCMELVSHGADPFQIVCQEAPGHHPEDIKGDGPEEDGPVYVGTHEHDDAEGAEFFKVPAKEGVEP